MTDSSNAVARLEEVLDRLERLGLVPPAPGQTAAVDPDGYPGRVVSGELIESAWGNAVADKIHDHGAYLYSTFIQAQAAVIAAASAGVFNINFPQPYASPPVVAVMNGDAGSGALFMGLSVVTTTGFTVNVKGEAPYGPHPGPIRFSWIAVGLMAGGPTG